MATKTPKKTPRKKSGPKPKWTTETKRLAMAEICGLITLKQSLPAICKLPGMPSITTVLDWARDDEEISVMYARAREMRADARADRIDEIAQLALDGKVDPHAARVAIDAEKWLAAREAPKRYGDKIEIEHSDGGLADALQAAAERVARFRLTQKTEPIVDQIEMIDNCLTE